MKIVVRYEFKVRSYECGPDGAVTLASVCNYLQEAASMHAAELGFSRSDFAAQGTDISWVLTRLRVRLARLPRWDETVVIETFPRLGRRITAYRDFRLLVGEETVGIATSEWTVIDLMTRRLVAIPEFALARADDETAPVFGDEGFLRPRWDCRETAGEAVFEARRGDIDLNGHVNNVHYVEWMVETLPVDVGRVRDFEIAFKSETRVGEEVRAASVEVEPGVFAAHVASPEGTDHAVARLVFAESMV